MNGITINLKIRKLHTWMDQMSSSSLNKGDISIVIPTYFRPEDISALFKSILIQTVLPKEVIVVDDTPDKSIFNMCIKFNNFFKNKDVVLIYARNKGERSSARARNMGIRLSRSKYVLFLDSDALLDRNYIKEILIIFDINDDALGVQGWVVGPGYRRKRGIKRYLSHFFNKLFLLGNSSINRCNLFEYPRILDTTIRCQWLSGSNMTVKRDILNMIKFDDKLYKYSFSEDMLLSHQIYQIHPNSLYMTPDAKLYHLASDQGRMKKSHISYRLIDSQRKYVLYKLFKQKGFLIYYRQKIGLFLLRNFLEKIIY